VGKAFFAHRQKNRSYQTGLVFKNRYFEKKYQDFSLFRKFK